MRLYPDRAWMNAMATCQQCGESWCHFFYPPSSIPSRLGYKLNFFLIFCCSRQFPALYHLLSRQQLHRLHQCSFRGCKHKFMLHTTNDDDSSRCFSGLYSSQGVHRDWVAFAQYLFRYLVFGVRPWLLCSRGPLQSYLDGQQCKPFLASSPQCH